MRKPNSIQVQDFLLVIISQGTLFTLEAEHEPTERVFTISLDSDSIAQATNGLFDNADKMAQGLKEAAESPFENIRLNISSEGKLTYTVVFTSGVIKKEFGFTLSLIEEEMDPSQIFSRKLNYVKKDMEDWKEAQEMNGQRLETKIESYQTMNEERFDKLENMMTQMEERMAQRLEKLENSVQNLQESIVFKPYISFNNAFESALQFRITNNGKTATLILPTCPYLEILPHIPLSGQFSYSLRLNNFSEATSFGIKSKTNGINWEDTKTQYEFWTFGGGISGRVNKEGNGKGPFGKKHSILTMVVNMDQGTLSFFIDDILVNFCSILKSDQYFAFVGFGNIGDSVTLL